MTADPISVPGPLDVEDARALFSGDLLRVGRELRGLSQTGLAREIGTSAAAVSQFEKGSARPSSERLGALADALQLPVGFFVPRTEDEDLDRHAFFRSLRSTPVAARRKAVAQALVVRWLTRTLERHVRLPEPAIQRYPLEIDADAGDVEPIAEQVRADLDLGLGPLSDAVQVVERQGVVAARLTVDQRDVDAFSIVIDSRPILMLADDKNDRGRSRFDAAHELGHWTMHDELDVGKKEAEQQADRFAAAFLMPAASIRDELRTRADARQLLALKSRWGVSMAALVRRARDLGRIDQHEYVRAMKQFSARGWRRREPGDLGTPEVPMLLQRALDVAAQHGWTLEALAAEVDLPEKDLRALLDASRDGRPGVAL